MKKSLMFVTALVAVLALTAGTPVKAACGQDSIPVTQAFAMITGCADANPVGYYAYQLGAAATVNSAGQDGVCEADAPATNGINQTCNPGPGVNGDGVVSVQYDWGSFNTASVGCPNPITEGQPVVVSQVTCNDGKGVIASAGYEGGFGGYLVDLAFPAGSDGLPTPIQADNSNSPIVTSVSAGPSPSVSSVTVHLNPTHVWSDCDPASAGFGAGFCSTAVPSVGTGRVYQVNAPCGTSPDPRLTAGWVLVNSPDAGGNLTIPITQPPTGCVYVGATGNVGGVETTAIAGAVQVAGQIASVDKIKIDKAAFNQGKLQVSFSTVNETSIVGFNVYAGSTKLNSGLVQAKGTGSNTYSFEAGRNDVKANRTVTVEAVKSDGSVVKSAPVSLK